MIEKLRDIYQQIRNNSACKQSFDQSFIAGGAIASLALGEEPKDYDVWFRSYDDAKIASDNMMLAPIKESRFAWSYRLPLGTEIQIVHSRTGTPKEVTGTFDFKHTQGFYVPGSDWWIEDLEYNEELIKSKKLIYNKGNLCHPVNTMQRFQKFIRRGYFMDQESIIDLMLDVKEADEWEIKLNHANKPGSR